MEVVGASSGLDLQLDVLIIAGEMTNCFIKNLSSVKFKKNLAPMDPFEILTLIKSQKPNKSIGYDNISALFIKIIKTP